MTLVEQVDRALETADGDREVAAKLLGWTGAKMRDALHDNKPLREKWLQGKRDVIIKRKPPLHPPKEEEVLSRDPAPMITLTERDVMAIEAIQDENDKLLKAMRLGGSTESALKTAQSSRWHSLEMMKPAAAILQQGIVLVQSEVTKEALAISRQLDYVAKQIELHPDQSEARAAWLVEQDRLHDKLMACSAVTTTNNKAFNETAIKAALLKYRQKRNGSNHPMKKPGYTEVIDAEAK